jgi:hypothetical protein
LNNNCCYCGQSDLRENPVNLLNQFIQKIYFRYFSAKWMQDNKKDRMWLREYDMDIDFIKDYGVMVYYKNNDLTHPDKMNEHTRNKLFVKLPSIIKALNNTICIGQYEEFMNEYEYFNKEVMTGKQHGHTMWKF